ncbi:MAG: patatin-like phospholipase family protein [Bryobacteraceae bacterium]
MEPLPPSRPLTALVLSGGGLFGAYQAGAWRAMAGRFHFDLIVGASIGSVNGWLIAGGCSPGELENYWLELGRRCPPRRQWPLPPWRGLVQPAQIDAALLEIHTAFTPKMDYAVVVTDLVRMRPVIVRGPEVTWRHLAASCAVPLVFRAPRIDGRRYVDGGLLSVNPVWAAAALGARRVIAINVLERMPSRILGMGANALRAVAPFRPDVPDEVQVTTVSPSERLGGLRDTLAPDLGRVRRWLDLGAEDAARLAAL